MNSPVLPPEDVQETIMVETIERDFKDFPPEIQKVEFDCPTFMMALEEKIFSTNGKEADYLLFQESECGTMEGLSTITYYRDGRPFLRGSFKSFPDKVNSYCLSLYWTIGMKDLSVLECR